MECWQTGRGRVELKAGVVGWFVESYFELWEDQRVVWSVLTAVVLQWSPLVAVGSEWRTVGV